jgi:superfamily I DNA and/or RNA helicase
MTALVDTLVIDEAGQVPLANLLAICGAASDLVLFGDPRQLAQPVQGSHPPGAAVSALEHLLAGQETMPPGRGLFLDVTWRMHPQLCQFISEVAYAGRLSSAPQCIQHRVGGDGPLSGSGVRFRPVNHRANRTSN